MYAAAVLDPPLMMKISILHWYMKTFGISWYMIIDFWWNQGGSEAFYYFRKTLHLRCLTGLRIRLCNEWQSLYFSSGWKYEKYTSSGIFTISLLVASINQQIFWYLSYEIIIMFLSLYSFLHAYSPKLVYFLYVFLRKCRYQKY